LMVQFVPGWSAAVQLLVCEKAPPVTMLEMVMDADPTFVAMIGIAGLATPTC